MKRLWMLLLTLALTVVIMAVPAMAAEHSNHDGWTVLESGTTALEGGNYYLTGDITASITSTSGNIVICLNGKTWSGSGARPLAVTGGNVTICDCAYVAPSVNRDTGAVGNATGGKIVGHAYSGKQSSGNGGAVNVASGASFTLESGTIMDGHAENGGNIFNAGTVTISGGLISNGETGFYGTDNKYESSATSGVRKGWGGNIENQGVLIISGGIISGGKSGGNGGNIRSVPAASFTMTGGVIAGGDSRDNGGNLFLQCDATMSDGLIIAGTANSGGNISINATSKTIALSGVTIKNGVNCGGKNANSQYGNDGKFALNTNAGGNVRVFSGTATLTIDNGTVITGGQSSATDGSQNVGLAKSGWTLNLGTCQIDGYVYVVNTCTINVDGAPRITGGTTNLRIGSSVVTVGAMTGGQIGITTTAGTSAAFTSAVSSAALENYFTSDNDALAVTYNYQDDKLWLGTAYCVCGASKNGGEHVRFTDANGNLVGCDGTKLGWLAWTATNALPKGHGNFYLTAATRYSAQYAPELNATMRLDLNGQTATDTSARTLATAKANSSGSVNLWITDTSAEKTGKLTTTTYTYTGQGVLARICDSSTLHLVAGTLDASNSRTVAKVETNKTTEYDGGAVTIEGGCTFNMYGGRIIGGEARYGGAVNINESATFNMYGGTISGGYARQHGGALHVAGTASITGGTISGGRALQGGNLYVAGTGNVTVSNTVIKDGVAIRNENVHNPDSEFNALKEEYADYKFATVSNTSGRGANIGSSGMLTMNECVVSGGRVEFASGAYETEQMYWYSTWLESLWMNYGGVGLYVTGTNKVVTLNDCKIYGTMEPAQGIEYICNTGGTIYANGNATLNLNGTLVTASKVEEAGAILYFSNANINLNDYTREDGTVAYTVLDASYYYTDTDGDGVFQRDTSLPVSTKRAVAVLQDNNFTLTMDGHSEIKGGRATNADGFGGAVMLSTTGAKITMKGNAKITQGSGLSGSTLYLVGTLNLHGGTISGDVDASGSKAVNVYGGKISNLYLGEKTLTLSNTLAADTNVVISCAEGAAGRVIANNVTSYNGGISYQNDLFCVGYDASAKTLVLQTAGVIVKGDKASYYGDLRQALAAAKSGEYVCLLMDQSGNVSFTGDIYLDLNGYDITGNVTVNGNLYLLDSATADYTVEDGHGFGTVTGTVTGVVRAFTTAAIRQNYGDHNYRYMVVCVDGKYSSHRIYITVKTTVLQPQVPGLNYRTVLRCNEYFAQLVNQQGGYGIVLNTKNSAGQATYTYGNYVQWGKTIKAYAQVGDEITEENNLVTQLGNILSSSNKNSTSNQYNASAKVTARAYIWISDDLAPALQDETAGDAAAKKAARIANAKTILENGVLTSAASNSLKDVVQLADTDSKWDTLSAVQKKTLGGMYGRWEELMKSWNLKNIPTVKDSYLQYGCLCGDSTSTNNPCANNGHVEFVWNIWEETDSLPTVSGNYYLKSDVTLSAQHEVEAGVTINLNTCGHNITASSDRVALVYGIFNLTNYSYDGTAVKASAISGHGHNTNDSGAVLLIEAGANVSLYSGLTVKTADSYNYKNGVVCVTGSLNIYGGNITGGDVTSNGGNGGAVYVNTNASMYMNAGTISGGTALNGGNLYVVGNFTMAGGTIENGVAMRDAADKNGGNGGNINIAASGNVTLSGGQIQNGQAGIDVNGKLSYTNASGTKKGWGGNINSVGTLSIQGTQITGGRCGGNGGSLYVNGGSFTLESGSLTGGQTDDQGGNLFLNTSATLTGGTMTGGKAVNGGNLALGNSSAGIAVTLRNVTLTGGEATTKGGNIHAQNANNAVGTHLTIEAGTQITGGKATAGGNIRLNCALNITGGEISGGLPANINSSNILVDNWPLTISGGTIGGGVHLNANTTDRDVSLTLTGAPVVTGSGILLQETAGKNLITVVLDTENLDRETASVVLRTATFVDGHADGIRLADSTGNEWLARRVLQDMAGFGGSEVTYEKDGIYLRKSTDSSIKWSCECGANYGETHVNGCDGYDVIYNKWTSKSLPNKPGNWYLSYTTTENAAGVAYVDSITTGTFGLDYYKDAAGAYHSVYTLRAMGTGNLTEDENYLVKDNGKYMSVAEYVAQYPNGPSYADDVGSTRYSKAGDTAYVVGGTAYTAGNMPHTVETAYTVRIDLNGYKLETGKGARAFSFRGFADPDGDGTVYSSTAACRTADVTLNLIDSSRGHTGSIASYGVYSEVTANGEPTRYSNSGTHWQSDMIWMDCTYNPDDKLIASYITLDASTVITGVGPALMVDGGSATFYGSTVIGGISQGSFIGSSRKIATTNNYGGGAIAVFSSGVLTLDNSEVKNGMSIYSNILHHDNGILYEQAIGGGNIFVNNGTLNLVDATITGGMALIDVNSEKTRLPSFSYGSGGGVYVVKGQVNISGNTQIKDNFTGTISGTKLTLAAMNEMGNNFYNCIDPKTATITKGVAANLFMSGNAMTLTNFTGEVHYSMEGAGTTYATKTVDPERTSYAYNLNNGGHRGTFATYTGTAPTAKTLICDDKGAPAFTAANNKVYYPATATDASGKTVSGSDVYKVGYAKVNIMHSLVDLAGGMNMTNYGGDRWTNELYAEDGAYHSAYYDIVNDPNGYILDFGKKDDDVNVWDTELYATVLATTDGEGDTVIIIGLDAQTHSTDVANKVKRMVSLATGVSQDNISVSSDHIHCAPAAGTSYVTYMGEDGKSHNQLDGNGRAIIKVDYATTFYSGIVKAATDALNNQKQVKSIEVGTLNTAESGTVRYNFTRNLELWSGGKQVGMKTDNYNTHFYSTKLISGSGYVMAGGTGNQIRDYLNTKLHIAGKNMVLEYESEADDDLQLVQYVTVDNKKIIMANFQTHPHLGSGGDSYYVHSDVVGAFRAWLEDYTGAQVLYFSGGGGNVNTTTSISDDQSKYPYYTSLQSGKYSATQKAAYLHSGTDTSNTPLTRVCKSNEWGYSLATAANAFLKGTGNMTVVLSSEVNGSRDVEVKVATYNGQVQVNKATDTAISKAAKICDWTTGGYKSGFVSFSEYETWSTYVTADYANRQDNVYSSFAATRIRQRVLREENGQSTYKMNLTAYAMGEIGFIAAPYEMFHENGTQIKEGSTASSKYAMTIVASLANGSNGYIPSAEGYANGGYSTDNTNFADGTGEELANQYIAMLNGLK